MAFADFFVRFRVLGSKFWGLGIRVEGFALPQGVHMWYVYTLSTQSAPATVNAAKSLLNHPSKYLYICIYTLPR